MDKIEKTLTFLLDTFEKSKYYFEHPEQKNYRIEHSIRVANIAKEIAENEKMDVEALIIAGLLHDIGYAHINDNWNEHGRISAEIARKILIELELSTKQIEEICFGIAIHVDGISHFEGEKTIFASSVSDADNIDRFDAYRLYEQLQYQKFDLLSLQNKEDYIEKKLHALKNYLNEELSTKTATCLWKEKIEFQIQYFVLLKKQLERSSRIQ